MVSIRHKPAFLPTAPLTTGCPIPLTSTFTKATSATRALSTPRSTRRHPTMSIILAPGQGAQTIDMGKSWRAACEPSAKVFEAAEEALGNTFGQPLTSLISSTADDAAATLSRTDVAQPAIFVTSMACWAGLQHVGLADASNLSVTAGLSLGEYTALAIAGAIRFEDALRLVTLRGRAMQEAAEASDGGMVALIGATEEKAAAVVTACAESDVLVCANFNAPGQVVLSGHTAAIDRAAEYAANELKLRVAKLDVAGAFHSPLMQPAANQLAEALADTEILPPKVPVMSNVTALPHATEEIRERLVQQLTNPVLWAKCCEYIKDNDEFAGQAWMELAPGKALSGMMRKIDRKIKITNYGEAPVEAEV